MLPILTSNNDSSFRLRRPLITTNGFLSGLDTTVAKHLDELNVLFGKRIFDQPAGHVAHGGGHAGAAAAAVGVAVGAAGGLAAAVGHAKPPGLDLDTELDRTLTPKRVESKGWAAGSIADALNKAAEADHLFTLSEIIDMTPQLSELKYAFDASLVDHWFDLETSVVSILDEDHRAIRDYLVAYAFYHMRLKEVNGLTNFILN